MGNAGQMFSKQETEANRERLIQADTMLVSSDLQIMRAGVRLMKSLYDQGGKSVPAEFNIDSELFDSRLALDFQHYSRKNIPVPTVESSLMQNQSNLFSILVSTVLYYAMYENYLGDGNPGLEKALSALSLAVASFAVTGTAVAVANKVATKMAQIAAPVTAKIGQAARHGRDCAKFLFGAVPGMPEYEKVNLK
jgi:hypothetical protein